MQSKVLSPMEDDIATYEAAGAPNERSGPPKRLALFALPRELRDMIYSKLVTSRNINILRASKTTHGEASIILHEKAICRLNIDNLNTGTLLPTTNIQHLDIQVAFPPGFQEDKESIYTRILQFGSAEIVRKTCHIRFAIFDTVAMRRELALTLDYLQTLFGSMYASVIFDIQALSEYLHLSPPRTYIVHCTPDNLHAFNIGHIKVSLETTMGPAKVREEPGSVRSYSDDGQEISTPRRYLEFHPRAHLQANRHSTISEFRVALMSGLFSDGSYRPDARSDGD